MPQYATLYSKGGTSPYLEEKGEMTLSSWFLVNSLSQRTKSSSWERLWCRCAKLRNCWEVFSEWGQPCSLAGVGCTALESVPAGAARPCLAPVGASGCCTSAGLGTDWGNPALTGERISPLSARCQFLAVSADSGIEREVILSRNKYLQVYSVNICNSVWPI